MSFCRFFPSFLHIKLLKLYVVVTLYPKFKTVKQTLSSTETEGVYVYESVKGLTYTLKKFKYDAELKKKNFSETDFWSGSLKGVHYGADLSSQSQNMRVLNDSSIYCKIPEAKNQDILGQTRYLSQASQTGLA